MSVSTAWRPSSSPLPRTSPIATPATGAARGTPASIMDSVLPQTEAMEVEPLEETISETTRMV